MDRSGYNKPNVDIGPPVFARILCVVISVAIIIFGLKTTYKKVAKSVTSHIKTAEEDLPRKYHLKAKSLTAKKRFKEAEEAANKSLSYDSRYYRAYMDLGSVYINTGDYIKAERSFQNALMLLGESVGNDKINQEVIYYNLGLVYELERRVQESWENYSKAYQMRSYLKKDYWGEGKRKVLKYVKEDDNRGFAEYIKNKTDLPSEFYKRKKAIQADLYSKNVSVIKECRDYLDNNPGSVYSYNIYGIMTTALISKGDTARAIEALKKVEEHNPPDNYQPWIKFSYAHIYSRTGDIKLAISYTEDVLNNHSDYELIDNVRSFYSKLKADSDHNSLDEQIEQ